MKLIKSYFNSYHLELESLLRKAKLRRKYRKISTNKIFISDGEFKHTNDKVNITLYVYNKQKLNYLLKLKKRYTSLFTKAKFTRKLKLISNVGLSILKQQQEKRKKQRERETQVWVKRDRLPHGLFVKLSPSRNRQRR